MRHSHSIYLHLLLAGVNFFPNTVETFGVDRSWFALHVPRGRKCFSKLGQHHTHDCGSFLKFSNCQVTIMYAVMHTSWNNLHIFPISYSLPHICSILFIWQPSDEVIWEGEPCKGMNEGKKLHVIGEERVEGWKVPSSFQRLSVERGQ